jgi:hypothetical protein
MPGCPRLFQSTGRTRLNGSRPAGWGRPHGPAATQCRDQKRPAFYVGDRVWVMKPKPVGGHKIQTYCTGPTTITSRTGASSFEVTTVNGDTREVHISQIKLYQDDVLEGGAPLHFYRPGHREATPKCMRYYPTVLKTRAYPISWYTGQDLPQNKTPGYPFWNLLDSNVICGHPIVWPTVSVL